LGASAVSDIRSTVVVANASNGILDGASLGQTAPSH
jgi:hypothetical protein